MRGDFSPFQFQQSAGNLKWISNESAAGHQRRRGKNIHLLSFSSSKMSLLLSGNFPITQGPSLTGAHIRWNCLADIVCLFAYRKFESQIWKSMKNGELGLCFLSTDKAATAVWTGALSIVIDTHRNYPLGLTCASASPFPKIRDEQTSHKNPGGDWWCHSVGASYIEKAEVIQRERKRISDML